jgi:hypothetical protein
LIVGFELRFFTSKDKKTVTPSSAECVVLANAESEEAVDEANAVKLGFSYSHQ